MTSIRILATVLALGALTQFAHAQQAPLTNACQTAYGVCFVGVAPVGAPCGCVPAPNMLHPGRMVFLPPAQPSNQVRAQSIKPISTACGTRFGVCQVGPAPVGSPCGCGSDPGQRIFFK